MPFTCMPVLLQKIAFNSAFIIVSWYLVQKLKKILDQVPADYYESGVKSNFLQKYWHTRKWHYLKEFFIGVSGKRLLDIGCADGTTTRQIKKILPSVRIVGIDLYKKAIDHAKGKENKIRFIHGDVHKLPF